MCKTMKAALVSRNENSEELNDQSCQFLIQTNELHTRLFQICMTAVATCQKGRGVCNVFRPCLGSKNIKKYKYTQCFGTVIFDSPTIDSLRKEVYYDVRGVKVMSKDSKLYKTFSTYSELESEFSSNQYIMWYGTAVVQDKRKHIKITSIFINSTIGAPKAAVFPTGSKVLCGSLTTKVIYVRFNLQSGYEYILEFEKNKVTQYYGSTWCPETISRDINFCK